MPDSVSFTAAWLAQYHVLEFTGADAVGFLHAQLSNDIAGLPPDRSAPAAHCNAQGRVSSLLRVWHTPRGMQALLPADQADAAIKRLRMFVLRSNVAIRLREDLTVVGLTGVTPGAAGDIPPVPADTVTRQGDVDCLGLPGSSPRAAIIGTPASLSALPLPDLGPDSTAWELGEIDAGLAQVWAATREVFLPHHLNLDLTGAVNFRKGCYPGQEIVARMHYRGRPTRRMLRASAPCPPPTPGTELWTPGHAQPQGQVVRASATLTGCRLLAVVQVTARGAALHLGRGDGPEVQLQTLPYGVPEWDGAVDNPGPARAP